MLGAMSIRSMWPRPAQALTVDAGDGADVLRVGEGNLSSDIRHGVSLEGGDDDEIDRLQIYDQLNAAADDYSIAGPSFLASGMPQPLTYGGFEELVVSGGPQDNVIEIANTTPGTAVIVDAAPATTRFASRHLRHHASRSLVACPTNRRVIRSCSRVPATAMAATVPARASRRMARFWWMARSLSFRAWNRFR